MAAPSISHSLLAPKRSWILLFIVAACLIFIGLGRLPLLEPDEGRNAEVAREMLLTHDWITPHFNGLAYLDKPTFLFWTIAGSFRAFGINEWTARFPSALAAMATLLLVWLMAARMCGEGTGLRAGIILVTAPLFFGFARFVIFDMALTLWVSVALYCFWLNSRRAFASKGLDALAFAAMGLATLTKGPVGFLLPLLTLLVYGALAGRMRELKKVHWLTGWLVLFAV
ncbi:MAG: ArnT family glycosyltransferase, partial [Terriglobia bacterium]